MSSDRDETLLSAAAGEALEADAADRFVVDVDGYEGPLHLLLDLARRQKVDLARISILALAEQYLVFITEARTRRIDLAADYLLMAAWLAFLKSRMLLPGAPEAEAGSEGDEMANVLAFRLKRLDAMRKAAQALQEGRIDGRDVFRRGMPESPVILREPVWTTSLHDVMRAFGDINTRRHRVKKHVVHRQPVLPLENARRRLKALLPELDDWRSVHLLRPSAAEAEAASARSIVASFFAASLELARDRDIDLRQDRVFAELLVRRARKDAATPQSGPMKAAG